MEDEKKFLGSLTLVRTSLLYILFFLFPIFFLTTTQEFYNLNKFYLLSFTILVYLAILTLEFIFVKKITWKKLVFEKSVMLFLAAFGLAVAISSPNKVEALLDPRLGFGIIAVLVGLYLIISQYGAKAIFLKLIFAAAMICAVLNILFFLEPFRSLSLPTGLQFLKSSGFTPLGSQLDLALFLGFFVIIQIINILSEKADRIYSAKASSSQITNLLVLILSLILSCYAIAKPIFKGEVQPLIPPTTYSWYTTVETLKQPKTAIFGVGPANYVSSFTRSKTQEYNKSQFWNLNFTTSRSLLLQIWTETGLLGFFSFGFLFLLVILKIRKTPAATFFPMLYLILIFIFFPASLPVLFLFFVTLAYLEDQLTSDVNHEKRIDLSEIVPAFLTLAVISILFIVGAVYLLGRSYLAEYNFKKSVDAISSNNASPVYDNLRQAIILNPYIERFRASFANVNILIANNIATKGADKLTDQDRQNITQAIQIAIAEAKNAVSLNSEKSANWENLAAIYRNIINTAQGADGWTIAAYQRAIVSDPANPSLRLNLGGVYYSLGNYDDAQTMFDQAINLKPDLANAHYNLAWTYFQKKEYTKAVQALQTALNLVDPKSVDYKKAQKELEQFKENLPQAENAPEEKTKPQTKELTLPTSAPEISPKIELPAEASPEAR